LKSAKECVTTHLPNESAPKMDSAKACHSYLTFEFKNDSKSRGAWRLVVKLLGVNLSETASSVDLGGSSNY